MKPKVKQNKGLFTLGLGVALAFSAPFLGAEEDDHKGHDHAEEHADHEGHDHEGHENCDHGAAKEAGPNGGRILTEIEPHAELLVTEDRKIQITFLSEEGEKVAPAEQKVTLIGGKRSAPTRMKFTVEDGVLLSDKALPEGMNIPVILQVKGTPDAKTETIRFNLNLEDCPTCDYLEYACTCDHSADGDDDHEGHDH